MNRSPELVNKTREKIIQQIEEEKSSKYYGDKQADMVDHPSHYNIGKIEVIDFMEDQEHLGTGRVTAIKYICRSPFKGKEIQDLEKAIWLLQRKIGQLKDIAMEETNV
jgi:hypothetical protein